MQQKLLNSKNLTLQTAMNLALSFESAAQSIKSLKFKETFSVDKINRPPAFQKQAKNYFVKPCYRSLNRVATQMGERNSLTFP